MKMWRHAAIGLLLSAMLIFCAANLAAERTSLTYDVKVTGGTEFAVDLYARLAEKPGNVFFSPFSVTTALGMTYGGARGETASQMAKTLHFTDAGKDNVHYTLGAMVKWLNNEVGKTKGCRVDVANALWGEKSQTFLPEYLKLVKENYDGGLTPMDFVNAPEDSRKTINDWVAEKTEQKIKDLLRPGMVTPLTRLVLTNAIYFKGDWTDQFDKKLTKDEPFTVSAAAPATAIGELVDPARMDKAEIVVRATCVRVPWVGPGKGGWPTWTLTISHVFKDAGDAAIKPGAKLTLIATPAQVNSAIDREATFYLRKDKDYGPGYVRLMDNTEKSISHESKAAAADAAKVTVPMMHRTGHYGYGEAPGYKYVELPYAGDYLSMFVFLPDTPDGMAAMEKSLTAETLTKLDGELKSPPKTEVDLALPKFTMTLRYDELGKTLAGMGMPIAFESGKADFSGMDGTNLLYISKVVHKAFVAVDEEGTEAAAATAVVMAGSAMPTKRVEFHADHPFVFLIRDRTGGPILFMGRVVDPTAK